METTKVLYLILAKISNFFKVDWSAIMKNVPRIEESKNFVDRERSQSPISNITDITVNENRVKFLDENNVVIKKSLFATTQDCVSKL